MIKYTPVQLNKNAPANCTHVLKIDGQYQYTEHDGIDYHVISQQGRKNGVKVSMDDNHRWFIYHRMPKNRATDTLKTGVSYGKFKDIDRADFNSETRFGQQKLSSKTEYEG